MFVSPIQQSWAAVSVMTQSVRLWYSAHESVQVHTGSNLLKVQIVTAALTLGSLVISVLLYGITQAATTWSVSAGRTWRRKLLTR